MNYSDPKRQKEYMREYQRKYYSNNKEAIKEGIIKKREESYSFIREVNGGFSPLTLEVIKLKNKGYTPAVTAEKLNKQATPLPASLVKQGYSAWTVCGVLFVYINQKRIVD